MDTTHHTIFNGCLVSFEGCSSTKKNLGYYLRFSDFIEEINKLGCLLIESRWTHIVLEEVYEGVWSGPKEESEKWLAWDEKSKKWKLCRKPKQAEGIVWWTC